MKSPVIKLECSDLQHTRTGDHQVKDEVARCKLRRPSDWRSPRASTSPEMKVVQIMKAAGETTGKVYEGILTRQVPVEIALPS